MNIFLINDTCLLIINCNKDEYLTEERQCNKCSNKYSYCSECTINECTKCDETNGYDLENKQCVKNTCNNGEYKAEDKTCKPCSNKFDHCSQCTINGCTQCDNTEIYTVIGSQCLHIENLIPHCL